MKHLTQLSLIFICTIPSLHSVEKDPKDEDLGHQQYARILSHQINQLETVTQYLLDRYRKKSPMDLPLDIYKELMREIDEIHASITQMCREPNIECDSLGLELLQELGSLTLLTPSRQVV
jgi:signal transduction histidine kinase